jgi:hypothetical protein
VAGPASDYAATAAAAHDVLLALYPANVAALDTAYATSLSYVPDGDAKTNGISVGQQTAAAIVALRANDGRNAGGTFTTSGGDGVWVPTPPGYLPALTPWVRFVTPWTMTSPSQYPAAHGCVSSAIVHTLQAFFETDDIAFTIDSMVAGLLQPVRSYARFSDALAEVERARVYGGMHYKNSTEQGSKLGQKVARNLARHFFRPSHGDDEREPRRGR